MSHEYFTTDTYGQAVLPYSIQFNSKKTKNGGKCQIKKNHMRHLG